MQNKCTTFLAGIMLLLAGHLALAGNPVINDQAALAEGQQPKDPGVFVQRLNRLLADLSD